DGGGLVWTIPVLAARCQPDGSIRLAVDAGDLCRHHADRGAALAGLDGATQDTRCPGRSAGAIGDAGAHRSIRASLLCAAGARLLHLRLPTRFRDRAPAVVPARSWPF